MRKLVLLLLLLLVPGIDGREPRRDAETGRIRILYIGDAWGPSPFFHMAAEPSFLGTPVPATYQHGGAYNDRQLRQFMRVYMPRTYRQFIESYDLLILSDTNRALYTKEQLEWFRRGVEEDAIGIMMVGGVEAFGGSGHPSWGNSPVEKALPVLSLSGQTYGGSSFKALPRIEDDPFTDSLPWKGMPLFYGMNLVTAKEGTRVYLADHLKSQPILVYWEYGRGSGLAHMPDWTPGWGAAVMTWEYYSDYVANMNYLNAGVKIPQDPLLMHQIRESLRIYALNRGLALSLMEFVEKFGAQVTSGEDRLEEIGEIYKEAQRHFIEQDYDSCLEVLNDIEVDFAELSQQLVDLKERALYWIYIVEWFTVSGTAIICGTILWTLMVRRRLYRDVRVTRAR